MDLNQTSNPDPHGVQRLLSLLRAQQDAAAAKEQSATPPPQHPFFPPSQPSPAPAQDEAARAARRVYNAEPRYGTGETHSDIYDPYSFNPFAPATNAAPKPPAESKDEPQDRSAMTFAQSLPVLSALSTDTAFIAELRKMRDDQHALERKLAAQYQSHATLARASKQQERPPASDRTLRESMLQQWDALRAKQARRLAELKVPTFGATTPTALKHQTKVFAVLVSMLDDDDDA